MLLLGFLHVFADVDLPVKVRIRSLSGLLDPSHHLSSTSSSSSSSSSPQSTSNSGSYSSRPFLSEIENVTEMYVTCQIFSEGLPLGMHISSTYKCFPANGHNFEWGEWLTFPIKYRDLPNKSHLVFTVWQIKSTFPGSVDEATGSGVSSKTIPGDTEVAWLEGQITGQVGLGLNAHPYGGLPFHSPSMRVVPLGGTTLPIFNRKK